MGNNLIYMRRRSGIMAQPHMETQTGDLVTFTGIKAPLSVLAQIVPVQSGSGDPSPENVRPITGWTGCKISRTGKNLLGGELLRQSLISALPGGTDDPTNRTFSFKSNTTANYGITYPTGLTGKFKENTVYTIVLTGYNASESSRAANLRVSYSNTTTTNLNFPEYTASKQTFVGHTDGSKTLDYIYKYAGSGTTVLYYDECGVFEGNLTAEDFAASNGQTLSVDWQSTAGTVYGGSLKVNKDGTGVLTEKWDNIASYNGETLPGRWISDRDIYAPGTAPTTGAQVCYELATPVTYNLTAEQVGQILSLKGINNIWSNTGETSVEYWKN